MRILVVGAGATGGYFGGRLAEAGRDVTFLVRPKRAEQLRAGGLRIVSEHGDVTLTPELVTPGDVTPDFGLVLLTVKAYSLPAAIEDFAPAVGPATLILPFLNGMAHIDLLAGRFGPDRVLGGICIVAATLDEGGRVVQLAGMQALGYGDRASPESAPVRALDPVLQGAMNCLMRGTVGQVMAAPGGRRFVDDLLAECLAVAVAHGYPVRDSSLGWMKATMTEPGSSFASSMYRDLIGGNPIEADQIIGDFVARGQARDVPVPLLSAAYTHLSVYQQALRQQTRVH